MEGFEDTIEQIPDVATVVTLCAIAGCTQLTRELLQAITHDVTSNQLAQLQIEGHLLPGGAHLKELDLMPLDRRAGGGAEPVVVVFQQPVTVFGEQPVKRPQHLANVDNRMTFADRQCVPLRLFVKHLLRSARPFLIDRFWHGSSESLAFGIVSLFLELPQSIGLIPAKRLASPLLLQGPRSELPRLIVQRHHRIIRTASNP